jgi:hypothetical protein
MSDDDDFTKPVDAVTPRAKFTELDATALWLATEPTRLS